MTTKRSGIILSFVFALGMWEATWAQSCPYVGGMYEADIPYQSNCQILVDTTDDDLVIDPRNPLLHTVLVSTMLWCDDRLADRGVGLYHQANVGSADESCVLELDIQADEFLIASEGEELDVGRGFGMNEDVIPGEPQAVCEEAIAREAILSNSVQILSVSASHVRFYPDQQPHTHFSCSGEHIVDIGFMQTTTFKVDGGRIYTITVNDGNEYIEAPMRYRALLERSDGGALVDTNAGVYTPMVGGETYDNGYTVRLTPTQ